MNPTKASKPHPRTHERYRLGNMTRFCFQKISDFCVGNKIGGRREQAPEPRKCKWEDGYREAGEMDRDVGEHV